VGFLGGGVSVGVSAVGLGCLVGQGWAVSVGRAGLPGSKTGSRRKDGDGERRSGIALTRPKNGS
jgi:hypothetical protein